MKLIFSFVFLFFSILSLQSKAQVLIEYEILQNMDLFDWLAFSDKEIIRSQIEHENEIFTLLGPNSTIIGLNFGKSGLIRLEQELELYRRGIKTGLPVDMREAEEAIQLHWENVNNIESQIKGHAGLAGGSVEFMPIVPMIGKAEDYYKGMRELHKGDHEVVFNMVEKKDEALYKALGSDDEVYAGFIAPYVQRYMEKMGDTAEAYWGSLQSAYNKKGPFNTDDVARLIEMYSNSLEIYKCFNKNFKESEGMNQKELMSSIQSWHTSQALLGANSLIKTYENFGMASNPGAVTIELLGFYEAPAEVKEKIGVFLREDILNNEEYIKADDRQRLITRANALIGLYSFGLATPEERELFNKAIEQEVIRYRNPHAFTGRPLPLPE